MTDAGLQEIADLCGRDRPAQVDGRRNSGRPERRDTGLARRARAQGLGIHVWTLRAENEFLPG